MSSVSLLSANLADFHPNTTHQKFYPSHRFRELFYDSYMAERDIGLVGGGEDFLSDRRPQSPQNGLSIPTTFNCITWGPQPELL